MLKTELAYNILEWAHAQIKIRWLLDIQFRFSSCPFIDSTLPSLCFMNEHLQTYELTFNFLAGNE